jgi:hypothetical protein
VVLRNDGVEAGGRESINPNKWMEENQRIGEGQEVEMTPNQVNEKLPRGNPRAWRSEKKKLWTN